MLALSVLQQVEHRVQQHVDAVGAGLGRRVLTRVVADAVVEPGTKTIPRDTARRSRRRRDRRRGDLSLLNPRSAAALATRSCICGGSARVGSAR